MSDKKNKQSINRNKAVPIRPRLLDHVVISLPDLDQARERFTQLGFNVLPDAQHNFGSRNAIIPFANGTFLEPLALGDKDLVQKHVIKGNPFLVRDRAFRFRYGRDDFGGGYSMSVLSGANAKADRKMFRKAGLRTGKMAVVKRPGLNIRASFALDERAPNCTFFACERKSGPPEFDEKLTDHSNGGLRLARICLVDHNPGDFVDYIRLVIGQDEVVENDHGFEFDLANGKLSLFNPDGLKQNYGIDIPHSHCNSGLIQVTWDIAVKSLDDTAMMLAQRGIEARQVGHRIVVANASGQGAMMAFVEE